MRVRILIRYLVFPGLLTYALVQDGLIEQRADADKVISLTEWLEYGVSDVPKLFGETKENSNAANQMSASLVREIKQ